MLSQLVRPLSEEQGTGRSQGCVSLGAPGPALLVQACDWLTASRPPLSQQLLLKLFGRWFDAGLAGWLTLPPLASSLVLVKGFSDYVLDLSYEHTTGQDPSRATTATSSLEAECCVFFLFTESLSFPSLLCFFLHDIKPRGYLPWKQSMLGVRCVFLCDPSEQGKGESGVLSRVVLEPQVLGDRQALASGTIFSPSLLADRWSKLKGLVTMTLTHSWRAEPVHPSPRASEQQPCSSHSEGCLCIQGIMLTRGSRVWWRKLFLFMVNRIVK